MTTRRRLEKLQGTLMKLVANLESCKLLLDDISNLPNTQNITNNSNPSNQQTLGATWTQKSSRRKRKES